MELLAVCDRVRVLVGDRVRVRVLLGVLGGVGEFVGVTLVVPVTGGVSLGLGVCVGVTMLPHTSMCATASALSCVLGAMLRSPHCSSCGPGSANAKVTRLQPLSEPSTAQGFVAYSTVALPATVEGAVSATDATNASVFHAVAPLPQDRLVSKRTYMDSMRPATGTEMVVCREVEALEGDPDSIAKYSAGAPGGG